MSIGVIGLASLYWPGWVIPAAVCAGLFYGLAGLQHVRNGERSTSENVATVSDLFIFAVMLAFLVAGAPAFGNPITRPRSNRLARPREHFLQSATHARTGNAEKPTIRPTEVGDDEHHAAERNRAQKHERECQFGSRRDQTVAGKNDHESYDQDFVERLK